MSTCKTKNHNTLNNSGQETLRGKKKSHFLTRITTISAPTGAACSCAGGRCGAWTHAQPPGTHVLPPRAFRVHSDKTWRQNDFLDTKLYLLARLHRLPVHGANPSAVTLSFPASLLKRFPRTHPGADDVSEDFANPWLTRPMALTWAPVCGLPPLRRLRAGKAARDSDRPRAGHECGHLYQPLATPPPTEKYSIKLNT